MAEWRDGSSVIQRTLHRPLVVLLEQNSTDEAVDRLGPLCGPSVGGDADDIDTPSDLAIESHSSGRHLDFYNAGPAIRITEAGTPDQVWFASLPAIAAAA